jgi:hypothetical protein
MKTEEVEHFVVVCALASDLYCPGYDRHPSLAKDSYLARSAVRYKIDAVQLSTFSYAAACARRLRRVAIF